MDRVSSEWVEQLCSPKRSSVRTLIVANLKGYQRQISASGGGSVLGETWMPSEGGRERIATGLIPVMLPISWSTAIPQACKKNKVVTRGITRINRAASSCLR